MDNLEEWRRLEWHGEERRGVEGTGEERNGTDCLAGKGEAMKTELTETGWKETITKKIDILNFGSRPYMSVYSWVEVNKRLGINRRKTCNYCERNWLDLKGDVHILITTDGNKMVCDDCNSILQSAIEIPEKIREEVKRI